MNIKITDNFLDEYTFTNLVNIAIPSSIEHGSQDMFLPWVYINGVSYKPNDEDVFVSSGGEKVKFEDYYNYQFVHMAYDNNMPQSKLYEMLVPALQKINPLALVRIKANLQPRADKIIEYPMHIDQNGFKGKTGILYLNTNNGYTLFKDGTKVESVANRYIEFDSTSIHTGTTCTDTNVRCVVNFNYFPYEQEIQ